MKIAKFNLSFFTETLLIVVLYFITAQLGFMFSIPPGNVTLLWLPSGLAVASLLLFNGRGLMGVWLGSFIANLWQMNSILPSAVVISVCIASGSTLQTFIVWRLLLRFFPTFFEDDLWLSLTYKDMFKFLGLTAVACLTAATVGVTTLWFAAQINSAAYFITWLTWWVGDWGGIAVGMPFFYALALFLVKRLSRNADPIFVLSLGIGISIFLFTLSLKQQAQSVAIKFNAEASIAQAAIDHTIQYAFHDLDSLQIPFTLSEEEITRDEFKAFSQPNLYGERATPGLQGLSWDPYITHDQRAATENAIQQEGFKDFQFTERNTTGVLIRAAERPDYVIVKYIEPLNENRTALGFNVASNPVRASALSLARDTGQITVTAPVTLVQDSESHPGFLIFAPVYKPGVPTLIAEDRRANLLGFVTSIIRIDKLIEASIAPLSIAGKDIYLFDVDMPSGKQLLYFHSANAGTDTKKIADSDLNPANLQSGLYHSQVINMGGRHWLTIIKPGAGSQSVNNPWGAWIVLITSLTITMLVANYLMNRQRFALTLLERLRLQEQLERTASIAPSMMNILKVDKNGSFSMPYASAAVEAVYGMSLNDIKHDLSPVLARIDPQDLERLQATIADSAKTMQPWSAEFRYQHVAKGLRWYASHSTPVQETDGSVLWYGVVDDITERKQAVDDLLYRQKLLEKVIQLGKEIASITNVDQCMRKVYDGIRTGLEFDRVGLFAYDAVHGRAKGVWGTDRAGAVVNNDWYDQPIDPLGGWAKTLQSPSRIIIENDYQATYNPPEDNEMYGVKQHISIAAWAGSTPVAIISVDSLVSGREIKAVDIEALQLFVGYAGLAIENARLQTDLEQRVQERTAEVQDLYEHAPAGYHSLDANGNFIMINQTELDWLGYARDELLGHSFERVLTETGKQAFHINFPIFKIQGETSNIELEFVRKNGEVFPVLLNSRAFIGDQGQFQYSRATVYNNSERKQAEQAVREGRERLQYFFDSASDLIQNMDEAGNYIYVNNAWCKTLGYTAQEAQQLSMRDVIDPDFHQHCMDTLHQLLQQPGSKELAVVFRTKAQAAVYVEGSVTSRLDMDGHLITNGMFRDITERKKAEDALRANLNRVNALYTISQASIEAMDLQGMLKIVTDTLVQTLSADRVNILVMDVPNRKIEYSYKGGPGLNEIMDISFEEAWSGLSGWALREQKIAWSSQADMDERESPVAQRRRQETYAGDIVVVPLFYQGNPLGTITVIYRPGDAAAKFVDFDVLPVIANQVAVAIEHLRAEMNLRKANVKLQHAMRVKDEFLATMSHELRTPLNGILGTSEILLTGYRGPLNDRQIQLVSTIDASGHHLLSLINDILDLSKIEADKFELHLEPVSIRDLCQSCLAFIKESASKKNIMVNFAVDPAVTIIEADARRLKQILVNLLSNAVKFTPTQGKVTLDISPSHEQGFVEFSISDTGIGISQADQKRLFTAFTQLDNSLTRNYEGTGLGLALVKRLTELHGGRITVKSEVGVGSQFIIQLPWHGLFADQVASEADVDMAADVTALVSEVKSKATILLVEDNLTNIMMISDYLDAMGYSLVYAHDGYEALEKAAENSPDLILMDIQMPKLDGFEATRRLRANPQFAVTPIIALTAHAMVGDRERCLEAGANDYMSKPVNLKVLLKMIQTYLS